MSTEENTASKINIRRSSLNQNDNKKYSQFTRFTGRRKTIDNVLPSNNEALSSPSILNRRRSIQPNHVRKTHTEWLADKIEERRRKSIAGRSSSMLPTIDASTLKRLQRLALQKSFEEWKKEKDEASKEQLEKEKQKEEVKEVISKTNTDHEELKKKKYEEWLRKKHEQDVETELTKIQKLRQTNSLKTTLN